MEFYVIVAGRPLHEEVDAYLVQSHGPGAARAKVIQAYREYYELNKESFVITRIVYHTLSELDAHIYAEWLAQGLDKRINGSD